MDPNNKNVLSLDKIDRLLTTIEESLGLQESKPNQAAENLYAVTRELFFSVPQCLGQESLTDEERDSLFQKKVLGRMSRETFIKKTQSRIKQVARHHGREKAFKKFDRQTI
jgi:hypothetical protein